MKGKEAKKMEHKKAHHEEKKMHHMKKGGKAMMKKGGHVEGEHGKKRLDKFARGGATNAESKVKSAAKMGGMSPMSGAGKMSGNIPEAKTDKEFN